MKNIDKTISEFLFPGNDREKKNRNIVARSSSVAIVGSVFPKNKDTDEQSQSINQSIDQSLSVTLLFQ